MDAKKNLLVDVAALVIYAIVANPAITGIALHEWIGLGVLVVFLVHTALHYDWIVDTLRQTRSNPSWSRTGNLVLDVLIVIAFMVCTVSGILVSGALLPALGMYADGYYFWDPLHSISAKVVLALLLIHIVVHWKWLAGVLKKGKGDRNDDTTK